MDWVDYAKGMAIILVVYRHSLVGLNRSGLLVPDYLYYAQEFVFNFRMPVFFVLSGIFLAKSLVKKGVPELLYKKVNTLLYPYLLWTFIMITIQILLSDYTNSERTARDYLYIITQPRELDHMWYLLALFNTSVLMILLWRFFYDRPVLHLLFAGCLHLLSFYLADYSLFSDLLYHYIFFAAGGIISNLLLTTRKLNVRKMLGYLVAVTPLFIIGQLTWLNLRPGNLEMQLLFLAIILVACIFFYLLCRVLYSARFFLWLVEIGKHSLYVYILHLLVISALRIFCFHVIGITNVYVIIILSLVLGISIPIFVYKAGKKWGIKYLFSLETPPVKIYG